MIWVLIFEIDKYWFFWVDIFEIANELPVVCEGLIAGFTVANMVRILPVLCNIIL